MITTYEDLPHIKQNVDGVPIYLKGGTFDLLHEGHEQLLAYLHKLGGISVVGISPDKRVKQRKGPSRPIRSQDQRMRDVDETGLVDFVFVVPEGVLGLPRSIERLKPDAYVEHISDALYPVVTKTVLGLAGVKYVVTDSPRVRSTTEIIEEQGGIPSFRLHARGDFGQA